MKNNPYLHHCSFRIRRPHPVSPFLDAGRSVLKNKVVAHDVLNKQACRAYPTLTFHSQSLEVFEVHIGVFIALISPFLTGKIII